jgi:hypothetical protein
MDFGWYGNRDIDAAVNYLVQLRVIPSGVGW